MKIILKIILINGKLLLDDNIRVFYSTIFKLLIKFQKLLLLS